MRLLARILVWVLVVAAIPSFAAAANKIDSLVLDKWEVQIGGYAASINTRMRLDNPRGGEGTTIDFEDDLGFDSGQTVARLEGSYLFGRKHQLTVGWFKAERESIRTISEEIEWGDEVFPINGEIGAFFNTEFVSIKYTWWFIHKERTAVGANAGFVVSSLGSGLGIRLEGQQVFDRQSDLSTDIPVPQLGIGVRQALTDKFIFKADGGFISFSNVADFSGDVWNFSAGVEHRTWQKFGFGANYSFSRFDIDSDKGGAVGKFEYDIGGLFFYLRAAF